MTTPHKCPCCDGYGERCPSGAAHCPAKEMIQCRACVGQGVLWLPVYDGRNTTTAREQLTRLVDWMGGYSMSSWQRLHETLVACTNEQDPAKQAEIVNQRWSAWACP